MKRVAWFLAAGLSFLAHGADEPAAPSARFPSPDGRFALRVTAESSDPGKIEVIEISSRHAVADLAEEAMEPASLALVWAPDSKSFAANFRAGERSETTAFFRWDGKRFAALASPEGDLGKMAVEPARKRELKAAGQAEDTVLRMVWSAWKTERWIDGSTAEIHGESAADYSENGEPKEIAVAVKARIRFGEEGKPEILEAAEMPAAD